MNTALLAILAGCFAIANSQFLIQGRAYVFNAQQDITQPFTLAGILEFRQELLNLRVTGTISGLTPGQHGFHVHERGDIGQGCNAALGHYNPLLMTHGAAGQVPPVLPPPVRHIGDMGNIVAGPNGVANVNLLLSGLGLFGPIHVVGRTVVVHALVDDLGQGPQPGSSITGNAGGRVACGIISRTV